jgi:regulator of protease activity HflC (stomatin/prohibitin superfamily)
VRTVVGRRALDELLTSRRRDVERAAASLLQERARRYGLGVVVTGVEFQDVHPPLAVVDAYRDVSRAGSDRQRRINEGNTERDEKLISARGQAAATVARAEADRTARTARASGEADSFTEQVSARDGSAALTDLRLYWETIASALADKTKVVLDADKAHPRHLIVPDFPPGASPALNAAIAAPPR